MNKTIDDVYLLVFWVLIDTWWNVNDVNDGDKLSADSVLIDTWWNVNAEDCHTLILTDTSFNRYMVECECLAISKSYNKQYGFNRYMVECE